MSYPLTYYVVAHFLLGGSGLKDINLYLYLFEFDYMLEALWFVAYLLFINTFFFTFYINDRAYKLYSGKKYFLLNSQNNKNAVSLKLTQEESAENLNGFSEAIRRIPKNKKKDEKF